MEVMCVRGQFGCSGGKRGMGLHPPGRLDLTPVFHFVSVRDSSALHLCPNQSTGLHLPPGPILSLTCGTQARSRTAFTGPKGGGDLESVTRKHTGITVSRGRLISEKIWIVLNLFFWRM